jgi:hypothetical protein
MLELKILLTQLFAESGAFGPPFNLKDIARTLDGAYGGVSYDCVRRAWLSLLEDDSTFPHVQPLDQPGREFKFDADAARRIARRAVSGELPEKYRKAAPGSKPTNRQPVSTLLSSSSLKTPEKRSLKTKTQLSATKVQTKRK